MDSWILSLLIFLPVMGALGMCVVPFSQYKENKDIYKYIALGATGIQLLLAVILYMKFDPSLTVLESPFTVQFDWISSFNIQYFIGVDGLSMPMVLLSALLSFLCILISWNVNKNVFGYFALFLLLDAGMMGVFLSLDFFLFYILGSNAFTYVFFNWYVGWSSKTLCCY